MFYLNGVLVAAGNSRELYVYIYVFEVLQNYIERHPWTTNEPSFEDVLNEDIFSGVQCYFELKKKKKSYTKMMTECSLLGELFCW